MGKVGGDECLLIFRHFFAGILLYQFLQGFFGKKNYWKIFEKSFLAVNIYGTTSASETMVILYFD